MYLFTCFSITHLKLHHIFVTPKIVKNFISNLDLSKVPVPDYIPVVFLKNCEPEVSYVLAELTNKCLEVSCSPCCSKVSSVVPIFKNIGRAVCS